MKFIEVGNELPSNSSFVEYLLCLKGMNRRTIQKSQIKDFNFKKSPKGNMQINCIM